MTTREEVEDGGGLRVSKKRLACNAARPIDFQREFLVAGLLASPRERRRFLGRAFERLLRAFRRVHSLTRILEAGTRRLQEGNLERQTLRNVLRQEQLFYTCNRRSPKVSLA